MLFTFNGKYLLLAVIVFFIEILIALFVTDTLVRPFVGDVLVVILIYCALRVFLKINYWRAALGVFILACAIEILQYFDYVKLLGLEQNRVLSVALGRTFEWLDFAAYFAGFLIITAVEKIVQSRRGI
jgi:hypothetical protein